MRSKNTKKSIIEKIEIPEGMRFIIENDKIILKKGEKELQRKINRTELLKKEDNQIIIETKNTTKEDLKFIGTLKAHIKNMLKGLQEGFVYKLKICSVHFPMNVSFDNEKSELIIKNFLGETAPRKAKILKNVEIKIEKDEIILSSFDKESVGQTAANIETATKIRGRDRRIFQDGIFITEKGDKKI